MAGRRTSRGATDGTRNGAGAGTDTGSGGNTRVERERPARNNWLGVIKYRYDLNTALYMLDPWERVLFNTVVLVVLAYVAYGAYRRWYAPILSPWISTIGSTV